MIVTHAWRAGRRQRSCFSELAAVHASEVRAATRDHSFVPLPIELDARWFWRWHAARDVYGECAQSVCSRACVPLEGRPVSSDCCA